MNAQERQLVDDLFDRLSKVEGAPRDADAEAAIARGLKSAPNAVYALVQTVLVQDEALRQAQARIEEWEAYYAEQQQQPQPQQGSFLDSMRGALFGHQQSGSVPRVQPNEPRPVWNSGQAPGAPPTQGYVSQGPGYAQQPQGYGQPQGGGLLGGGGSFLGTAAAAAAGMVGGSLLMNSLRGLSGGHHQAFGDGGGRAPWGGDQSGGPLARDAGLNDIGNSHRADGGSRQGLFDQAALDDEGDDSDDGDDDFDAGDSDVA